MKSEVETLNKRIADLEAKLAASERGRDAHRSLHIDYERRLTASEATLAVWQDRAEKDLKASEAENARLKDELSKATAHEVALEADHEQDGAVISADRHIDDLRAENQRLREALAELYEAYRGHNTFHITSFKAGALFEQALKPEESR